MNVGALREAPKKDIIILTQPAQRYLKMGQAEAYTGRKRRWIIARIEEGDIDGKKVRNQWVVDRVSIDQYLGVESDDNLLDIARRLRA